MSLFRWAVIVCMMNRTQTVCLSDMSNNNQKNNPINLPHRDQVTAFQVQTVLNIVGVLSGVLHGPPVFIEQNIPQKKELDGGVKNSVETTLIHACSRLDDILTDPARWTFAMQEHLEYKLAALYHEETIWRQAQTRMINEHNSPHYNYNPTIIKLDTNEYIAIMGDPQDMDNAVYGVGESPAQALEAFDTVFNGGMPDSMVRWLAKQEQLAKEQRQHEQQQKSLVRKGSRTIGKAKTGRKNPPANGNGPGPEPQVGGA